MAVTNLQARKRALMTMLKQSKKAAPKGPKTPINEEASYAAGTPPRVSTKGGTLA